jgi:hypothetical protein
MSSIFVLDQTANVIDQTINAAYSGLVLAGTGLVRTSGDQNISGKKIFHGAVDFTGSSINFTGVSSFVPFSNASIDVGSSSRTFRTGFFSGVSGYTGYFENLRVGNLITSLIPSLVGVTGNNMTLSGTTNISTANVSGNLGVTGNLLVRGVTTLSGDVSFLGAVSATGNKTFSGVLNQSGNVNIYGQTFISGDSSFTGNLNITGNLFLKGNQNITGDFTHTGQHFVNSNNSNITFTGGGANHAVKIYAPTYLYGTLYHTGSLFHTGNVFHSGNSTSTGDISNEGNFSNVGNFSNIGNFNLWGNAIINTGTSINFNANPKFNSGISCSGNSITPSLRINSNLVSAPSGGAIEYSRGQFFATNELIGTPTRSLINETYSYISPKNFYTGSGTHILVPLLGNTGIYLNTGKYKIKYDVKFNKSANSTISLGITGDQSSIAYSIASLSSRVLLAAEAETKHILFNSNSTILVNNIFLTGFPNIDGAELNFYSFESEISINKLTKIRPIYRTSTAVANTVVTGAYLSMEVQTIATGTGFGLAEANGPWSDS